ncbi:MAG: hypothetical protein ACI8TP_003196 [Acidimicrobiales bacterium]
MQRGFQAERDLILALLKPLDDALATETEAEYVSLFTTQRLALHQSLAKDSPPSKTTFEPSQAS